LEANFFDKKSFQPNPKWNFFPTSIFLKRKKTLLFRARKTVHSDTCPTQLLFREIDRFSIPFDNPPVVSPVLKGDAMRTHIPPFILRVSFLLALTGGFIGVLIGWNNGDELGWSLLRGALLFLAFGSIARWWLGTMAKAWLESRLESLQVKSKTVDNRSPARAGL
jgi:hypothetical protein